MALERLTFHVENSPFAVVEFDQDLRITSWSGQAERTFGWTAAEVLGTCVDEFRWVHEEDADRVAAAAAEMRAGRRSNTTITNRNYRKDGSVIVCEWYNSALMDSSGELSSIRGLAVDVTARVSSEASLRESEGRLRRAQEIAEVGHWEIDLATQRIWASDEAFRIYGLERESPWLPLAEVQAMTLPEYRPALNEALGRLIADGVAYDQEFEISRADDGEASLRPLPRRACPGRRRSGGPGGRRRFRT